MLGGAALGTFRASSVANLEETYLYASTDSGVGKTKSVWL